jgi:hypothetical protein
MFCLPEIHPRLARHRRFIVPGVLLLALVLTLWPWVGVSPQLRRVPAHLIALVVVWLALAGARRLRMPRWSLPVVAAILTLCFLAVFWATGIFFFGLLFAIFAISALLLLPAVAVGRIAARAIHAPILLNTTGFYNCGGTSTPGACAWTKNSMKHLLDAIARTPGSRLGEWAFLNSKRSSFSLFSLERFADRKLP